MRILKGIKLQSLILLLVLPALFLLTGLYAFQNYYTLYGTIIKGFDRKLFAVSTTSASFIDGERHKAIQSEDNPDYARYVEPMKYILKNADLTYHYTLVPQKDNKIIYILDATEGEDHSTAGTLEENPEEEANRLNLIMESGNASLSDIQEFDIWGQLKIGSAPIFNDQGEVTGLSGADVNISTINAKTSHAMLMVFGIGVAGFALATWVSFVIAARLINPIESIKQAALQVAAGNFGVQAEIRQPKELKELAEAFNATSISLRDASENELKNTREQIEFRKIQGLKEYFKYTESPLGENFSLLFADSAGSVSGYISHKEITVAWFGNSNSDDLHIRKINSDLRIITDRLLTAHQSNEQKLLIRLKELCGMDAEYFLFCDHNSRTIKLITKEVISPALSYEKETKIELKQGMDIEKLTQIVSREVYASH